MLKMEDLVTNCDECKTTGRHKDAERVGPLDCPKCEGKGVVFTEQGKVLRAFVKIAQEKDGRFA